MVKMENSCITFEAQTLLKFFNPNLVLFLVQFHNLFHSLQFEDQNLIDHTFFNLFT